MSQADIHSHHRGWKPWLNFGYLILPAFLFTLGTMGYLRADFKEYELKILGDREWLYLSLLLVLPVVAAFACILALFFKSNKDGDTDQFLKFCLLFMSVTPCSYLALWCLYVHDVRPDWSQAFSACAFLLILLLIALLLYTTYLIMWTPESPSPALEEADVKPRYWQTLCRTLKSHMDSAETQPGSFSLLHRFRNKDLVEAIRKEKLPRGNRDDVIDELNSLLSEPGIHEARDFDRAPKPDRDHLRSEYDWQVYNRALFDNAYAESLKAKRWRDKALSSLKKRAADRQERLKSGVAKSSFWAMGFFFTIFLGITYLLAFAFAFHDKATLRDGGKPALFSPRSSLYNVGEYQAEAGGGAQAARAAAGGPGTWPEYVFYFDNYSAMPLYKSAFDQESFDGMVKTKKESDQAAKELREPGTLSPANRARLAPKVLTRKGEKEISDGMAAARARWKQWKNSQHLDRLVEAIVSEDSARHGQGLLIQVRGSASDPPVKNADEAGSSYPNNYALSEARAQAVKYALLEKLARRGRLHGGLQWVILPLSNETPSLPLLPDEIPSTESGPGAGEDPVAAAGREIADSQMSGADKATLNGHLDAVRNLRGVKTLDDEQVADLVNRLRLYQKLLADGGGGGSKEEREAQKVKRRHAAADLQEAVADLTHEHVDRDARKRAAVVSVRPVQQSLGHLFAPLSLMDYVYYTITGYGNIAPTTTYAKFLGTSASILHVFFFVVFFNGLLSMKKGREQSPEGRDLPVAAVSPGGDARNGNSEGGAGRAAPPDLQKLQATLDEVNKLLHTIKESRKEGVMSRLKGFLR